MNECKRRPKNLKFVKDSNVNAAFTCRACVRVRCKAGRNTSIQCALRWAFPAFWSGKSFWIGLLRLNQHKRRDHIKQFLKNWTGCVYLSCMCSSALQSWTKYFHTVRSAMSFRCFLKWRIILDRSPASANSKTILSSLSWMKDDKYLMTFGCSSCCNNWISFNAGPS